MKHVCLVIANNSTVPYFNWFAKAAAEKKNVRFTFIALCKEKPQMIEEVGKFGFDCHWVYFDHEKRKRGWVYSTIKLFFLFKSIKPDIVHTHLFDDSVPALTAAKLAGVKRRIVTKGDTAYHWYFAKKGVIADRWINDFATDIVAISNESKQFIETKEQADFRKLKLIHHGILIDERLESIDPLVRQQFVDRFNLQNKIVIGVVSRLVEWKGHSYIIEAARIFCANHPDSIILIVGLGGQQEELKHKIEEYNLTDQVILVGWVPQNEIPSLFDTFNIFLHAASMEPFGFVIAEAMAHSLPIVATNTGAAGDAIQHKENGYLIEPKNFEQINEGLEWTLSNNIEKKLNIAAQRTVRKMFEFSMMYDRYIELYNGPKEILESNLVGSNIPKKQVMMIIANSSDPAYFRWFAELNHLENSFDLRFVFLHTELPPIAERVKKFNAISYWIYFDTYRWKPLQYIISSFRFYLLFVRKKPDVVHTNLFDDSLPALFAARLAGVRQRVITKQDTGFHVNYAPSIVKFDVFNNFNATKLIACSEESKEIIIEKEKGDESKIILIHHAVDEKMVTDSTPENIEKVRSKHNLKDKFVVGTVARYIALKGYPDMIDAAAELVKKNKNIVFLGVGWGRQQEEFQNKINKLELQDNFILTGKVEYELMPSYYACMNVYLHGAVIEPFGFVIAEAMFNKIPVISTRVGASRDFLSHKENAYLIDFNSAPDMIKGVEYMMNLNKNELQIIADKAYRIAKDNFSREKMWGEYKKVFLSN